MPDVQMEKARVGWKTVPFGKAVRNITERAEPTAEDSETYVGLGHLDTGSLAVRRWGSERDLEGTKLRMRIGDVLFAKRNAYLKRVAIAPHDGLFSAHGMVLRANEELMLHDFLPFFMQSDYFWDRAIGISVGSLSPTINWKTLAKEEFVLPPIEEQRRMVEGLIAARDTEERLRDLLASARVAEAAAFYDRIFDRNTMMEENSVANEWDRLRPECPMIPINELADVAYGISAAVSKNTDSSIGWPILTGANITLDGTLSMHKLVYHPEPRKDDFILRKGDVLLNWRSGSAEHVGKAALFDLDGDWTFASFILRIRVGSCMDNRFLWRLLNFMRERQLFGKSMSQQINFKMNATFFRSVEVPCPTPANQERIVSELSQHWRAIVEIESRIAAIRKFRNAALRGGDA